MRGIRLDAHLVRRDHPPKTGPDFLYCRVRELPDLGAACRVSILEEDINRALFAIADGTIYQISNRDCHNDEPDDPERDIV